MIRITLALAISLMAISLGTATANNTPPPASPTNAEQSSAIVTGIVVARDGSTVTLKSDGKLYKVDASNAKVLLDQLPGTCMSLRVGDRIRAYGTETAPYQIKADRVHIFLSEEEAAAMRVPAPPVTSPVPSVAAGAGTGVGASDTDIADIDASYGSWRSRGLVIGVDYPQRIVTIRTSQGTYVVDTSAATVVSGYTTVPRSVISQGDVLVVRGDVAGLNKIRADRIDILGQRARQESALALKTISARGQIVYIDYPSFTFKINTDSGELRILADENTFIHFRTERRRGRSCRRPSAPL